LIDKTLATWQRQCQLGKLDIDNQKTIIILPKTEGEHRGEYRGGEGVSTSSGNSRSSRHRVFDKSIDKWDSLLADRHLNVN